MKNRTLPNRCAVEKALLLATTVVAFGIPLSTQAGLFDRLSGPPPRPDLTESSDRAEIFAKGFSDPNASASDIKRADIAERKIAIASFQIEFALEQVAKGKAANREPVEKIYTLNEVTEPRVQAITDLAYTAFVATLKARGYEVLPVQALETASFKAELVNASKPPVKWERSGLHKGFVGSGGQFERDNTSITATAKGTAPDGWERSFQTPAGMKLAEELGAAVIEVRLKFNFARFDDSGVWGWAAVDDKPQNTLGSTGTRINVFAPGGKWLPYQLKTPVLLPNRVAEKATEVAMTGGQVAATTAVTGIKALAGFWRGGLSGGLQSAGGSAIAVARSGNYVVTADADYDTNTQKDLGLALEMIAEVLPK